MSAIFGVPLLEVKGLRVTVTGPPTYDVVRGVDFSLGSGEVFGLVGESGSGKTTTALAMLGYARRGMVLGGSVRIDGVDLVAASEVERRRARGHVVSYVPQNPGASLNPALRIGSQLAEMLGAPARSAGEGRIAELLDKVDLPTSREFLRRYPHQLSGGQLQRVCIAMAMLNRPRLIVFDEPTTGLDVTTQAHVLETIRELITSEQTAAMYVTHDLAVISEITQRIAVMYDGLIVEESDSRTVLTTSAHPYTRRLVLSTPSVTRRQALVGIAGKPLSPLDRPAGCPFAPRCSEVQPECRGSLPKLEEVVPAHFARCFRAAELLGRTERVATTVSTWSDPVLEDASLLHLAGVHARYGDTEVLHGVDLTVRSGECLALVGESGSGKTTLARCTIGVHPDDVDGYLNFDGSTLPWRARERSPEQRRAIQYIFQNPHASLNPRHTIGQLVAQPLETFGIGGGSTERLGRAKELLDRVNLPASYVNRYPNQLSGGELQRVAIARALATEPRLIICDEITSALDVSIQASVLELLGKLRREEQLTLLFITHNLGIVRAIADQIVILQGGVVVERGDAAAVLDHPSDAYTLDLLANTPVMVAVGDPA